MRHALLLALPLLLALAGLRAQTPAPAPALHVETRGAGTPTLLLPGFATPGEVFHATADSLGDGRAYHSFTYAGFAGTLPIDTPWYPRVRDALFAYVETHDLRDVDLVGHSMGGNLATEVAARFPERVAHLVIVDALPCMREVMMPGVPAEVMRYDAPQTLAMLDVDATSVKTMNAQMATGMTTRDDKRELLASWLDAADRETFVFGYVDLLRMDLRPLLSKITAPTTVLAAPSFGAEVVRHNMQAQYAELPHAKLHVAPTGAHYLMWDAEDWYVAKLREALVATSVKTPTTATRGE